jgi:gluconokinase
MTKGKPLADGPLVVALDIGTSSVRAIVFDSMGHAGLDVQVKYPQHTTADGGVEVDAEFLLLTVINCLGKVLHRTSSLLDRVVAVGISCFWHSLVGIDREGRATTPVYSWADTRSASYAQLLRRELDADAYHLQTGCELHPCFWPAKLLWLRSTFPEIVQQTSRWMGFGDFLFLRLFGSEGCSLSMASATGLFDQKTLDWDDGLLEKVGIGRDSLLNITELTPITGLRQEFLDTLHRYAKIPFYPAIGDGACSNIGSGGTDETRMVLNIGTSAALRVVAPIEQGGDPGVRNGLFTYRVDGQSIVSGGAFANGGNVYAWFKQLFQWGDEEAFAKKLAAVKPDSHGLTILPFWSGERSPGWHPDAHASIDGMNLHTGPVELVRASLEACAHSFDSSRRAIRKRFPLAKQIVISGGAVASSNVFTQIICDVFGQELITSRVAEASSRGAALIALRGQGVYAKLSDVPFERAHVFTPNKSWHEIYGAAAKRYQEHYEQRFDT